MQKRKLVFSFLDRVAVKNKLQIQLIREAGLHSVFLVNSYDSSAEKFFTESDIYEQLNPGFLSRLFQVISLFIKNRKGIHHLEVHPGGRFSFLYVMMARVLFLKIICVERGDLCYLISKRYDLMTRISMYLCYRWSNLIWYREVYMEEELKKFGFGHKLFFLHNVVDMPSKNEEEQKSFQQCNIDFLWLNRFIPERKSDWVVDILKASEFAETNNVMAGLLNETTYKNEQDYVLLNKLENLKILNFINDPSILYIRSKFFLLPASIVFANNALLEAMSYGVVPIVTQSPGVELIVEDGINGFIAEFNKKSLDSVMRKALSLNEESYTLMSEAAKKHVSIHFSTELYRSQLIELYNKIQN